MRPILSVVGRSHSGKTTLLEKLISELKKRGIRVAVIKHVGEEFELEPPGKDSQRFAQAGSTVVGLSSARKLAIIKPVDHDWSPQELARFILWDYDLLLTEGFKKSHNPKIEVHRKEQGPGLLTSPKELIAVVTDEPVEAEVPQLAPVEVVPLADLIAGWLEKQPTEDSVELMVNEKHINLNPFVKSFISKTVQGIVSSLEGVEEVESLHISLRRKA